MVSNSDFRKLALSFPDTVELPHFEKTSFRANKRIFATLAEKEKIACLLFSPLEQSVFCAFDKEVMYPVPNKWGKNGATFVDLTKVKKAMLKDALRVAYCKVAPKEIAEKFQLK
jgi:hypothetical protein